MDTRRLTRSDTAEAAEVLRLGGLLGIPTETVYGLGADGLNASAVRAIFAAKGRPPDNPLILHIPGPDWLERYCRDIPPAARALAARFWPGPLTLILKRREVVPDVVTAGLDTVGMRCPACQVTRDVIALAGVPVAAPSGNTSGRPSPTSAADMLEDMDGKIDAILDDGPCSVGVESTILDLTATPPRLLRPGGVTLEALEHVLGEVAVDGAVRRPMQPGERPRAPGMKYRHYAPRAPVTVVKGAPHQTAAWIAAHCNTVGNTGCNTGGNTGDGIICFDEYREQFAGSPVQSIGPEGDPAEHARRIFDALRAFDRLDVSHIWAQSPPDTGLGLAVVNRLDKAAGFDIFVVPEIISEQEGIPLDLMQAGVSREKALEVLKQYNADPFHIRHALTVSAVMGWFAEELGYGAEREFWSLVGLLHDVDFERWPEEHCVRAPALLREAGCSEAFIHAVVCHGWGMTGTDAKPELEMERVLFACDELTGLIGAAALMRPSKSVCDMERKSLKKKFKDKKFAAGCSRETIQQGADLLGWELDTLLDRTLSAMRACEAEIEAAVAENV